MNADPSDKRLDEPRDEPSDEHDRAASEAPGHGVDERLDDLNRNLREAAHPGIGAGMTFAVVALLGAGAGYWLDGRFGTTPWLVIAGTLFGAVFGFIHLVETIAPGTLFKARRTRR
ncbi:MAG: AtpZ/AtpI family protein [Planctomycetes bacterium]|nr:AtpZ/AtpI family protein [Planctomycetota bacterium]